MELVIAEKPSVAQAIAGVLKAKERKDGYMQGGGYIISWCFGHLLELAEAESYNQIYEKWRYEDLPIVPDKWKYIVLKDKSKQLKILSDLMKSKDVSTVICATDAGREGELIFRTVYNHCGCKKPIKRLWISSMEETAIAEGFRNLRDGADYNRLYQSALCRSHADWLVGINATRLFTVLYRETLNVGRVQTPTLALLATRENAIAAFVKEPFYTVELNCGSFTLSGEKQKDRLYADGIRSACDGKIAVIRNVRQQEKGIEPPRLYDLTTLQREANRVFGYTAQQTLDYLQSLYEKKLTTYPRTDSRYLTEDMAAKLPALVEAVAAILSFANGKELSIDARRAVDNSKVSDHHAIIPTQTMTDADLSSLPAGERDILNMLGVRLICAVTDKHIYSETEITAECENSIFKAKGKIILKEGWKAFEKAFKNTVKNNTKDDGDDNKSLPELTEGQSFENVRAELHEGFSSPPKHYTEDTLLAAMESAGAEDMPEDAERKGLGTPATRAAILEKLVKSGFVERKQKQLLPTNKGFNLITVVPDSVKSPELTAEWENKLKQIEQGGISADTFINGIAEMVSELIAANNRPKPEYQALFAESIGACPRCGNNVYESKKGFFCGNRDCQFGLWKDNKFFSAKKKELTKEIATTLLKDGCVRMTGLHSEKTGKTYDATVILNDTGEKYVNFRLEF